MKVFEYFWFNFCISLSFFLSIGWQALATPQNPMDMLEAAKTQIEASVDAVSSHFSKSAQQWGQPAPYEPVPDRFKRQTSNEEYSDENSEIIPDLEHPQSEHLGQKIQETLQKLSDGMKNMWQNVSETMKQFVDTIRRAFGNEQDYDLSELVTPEYENQT